MKGARANINVVAEDTSGFELEGVLTLTHNVYRLTAEDTGQLQHKRLLTKMIVAGKESFELQIHTGATCNLLRISDLPQSAELNRSNG